MVYGPTALLCDVRYWQSMRHTVLSDVRTGTGYPATAVLCDVRYWERDRVWTLHLQLFPLAKLSLLAPYPISVPRSA
eukprot:3941203-Rhodomonas_salina.3